MARIYKPKPVIGADDLEIIYPERSVPVAGEIWSIREYSLREGARYAGLARKALDELDAGRPAGPDLVRLLAQAVGKDEFRVAGLEDEDFHLLLRTWREINAAWFTDDPRKVRRGGKPRRWGNVYCTLIARGHDLDQIGDYTLRQIQLYLDESDRSERSDRASRILDINMGTNGGKEANRLMALLRREIQ